VYPAYAGYTSTGPVYVGYTTVWLG
jgi:hypothetical protein